LSKENHDYTIRAPGAGGIEMDKCSEPTGENCPVDYCLTKDGKRCKYLVKEK